MNLPEIEKRLEDYIYEISNEGRLTRVGLKDTSEAAAIQQKYADLFKKDAVDALAAALAEADGVRREELKRYHAYLQDGYLYNSFAERMDAQLTRLLGTKVEVDGKEIGYFELQPRWVNEPDFAKRDRLYDAFLKVNRDELPFQQELVAEELGQLAEEFGETDYVAYMAKRKDFAYAPFLAKLQVLADKLRPMYEQVMEGRTKAAFRKPLGTMRPVHANYLNQLGEFTEFFPAERLVPVVEGTLGELGLDLKSFPNIHVDVEDRPKKNPRAFVTTPKVPDEVHLVIKPVGGIYDYETFLHEGGHALHFANTSRELPFALRALSTSYALTEVYSFLFESLVYEPLWLGDALGLSSAQAGEIARLSRLVNLFMYLRYVAKLEYELEFYKNPTDWQGNAEKYSSILSTATGFHYPQENFLWDFDAGLYSADYLRAWVTRAQLSEFLVQEFGERWWTNAETGEYLKALWAEGESIQNEDIAERIGATPHDTGALERFFTALLA